MCCVLGLAGWFLMDARTDKSPDEQHASRSHRGAPESQHIFYSDSVALVQALTLRMHTVLAPDFFQCACVGRER